MTTNRWTFLLLAVALTACAPRTVIRFAEAPPEAVVVERVFVGTTRTDDPDGTLNIGKRSFETRYLRQDISLPIDRQAGSLPMPPRRGEVDPRRQIATLAERRFDSDADFRAELAEAMRGTRRGMREAVVFVHGFNNTFAEGLYRFAQLNRDLDLPGVPVHYSWPSKANALGYAYDRDSALFSRDGLEKLLHQVALAGADRILLVAHSMGGHLTMEALRQMAIRKDDKVMRRIGGVLLISPDIDVDVFRAQAQAIGRLPQPFVVFTSARDRALALSATIAREQARLGNLRDVRALAGLDVTLLEVGAFASGDGHFTAGNSPALIKLLNRIGDIDEALGQDATSRVGLLPGAVLTVQGATQIILSPVAAIGQGLAQ
ncbi:MAG: alpha/beta hydrolase [Gemmobacter sp.]|uniref:alpha/beta hydrolase n=1 Tax=Gemmobacter sp. TaxID=1898957 RepID=UPI00391B0FA6